MSADGQSEGLEDGDGVQELGEVHVDQDEEGAGVGEVQLAADMHKVHVDGEGHVLQHH